MPRYKLTIEYDGRPFKGFQMQEAWQGHTVQGELTRAIYEMSGEMVNVFVSGRTDAGVHALAQVSHIDLSKEWNPLVIRDALNARLRPHPISLLEAELVDDDFHCRFNCKKRYYLYKILNRRAPPAVHAGLVWGVTRPLNIDLMREGASHLLGHHDFSTFRAAACQGKSPFKTLDDFTIIQVDDMIEIRTHSRSFLHHQVRSMVGSLVHVGLGDKEPSWIKDILESKDRKKCGQVAPPFGLYFVKADY
jgi:tRNA pseudouridine38-40 synthase